MGGRRFAKHSGLRAAVHRDLVNPERSMPRGGGPSDRLVESRQRADYLELVAFEAGEVEKMIADAESFVAELDRVLHGRTAKRGAPL